MSVDIPLLRSFKGEIDELEAPNIPPLAGLSKQLLRMIALVSQNRIRISGKKNRVRASWP
jgi:hypothetical protein